MGMRFAEGAPVFAVEVRSVNDYGPAAIDDLHYMPLGTCDRCAREVAAQMLASRNPAQLERTRMAGRLLLWLGAPLLTGGGMRHLACRYRDDLPFVDWAREALTGSED